MSRPVLPPEILALSVSDRVALVQQLWDSIAADETSFELTADQKAELDRRLSCRAESPNRGSPWSEVKERIQGGS